MMIRTLLKGLCLLGLVMPMLSFQALKVGSSLDLGLKRKATVSHAVMRKCNVLSLSAVLDRRSFLNTAAFIAGGSFASKVSAEDQLVDEIAKALLELSNQTPYDDATIALFSDGSKMFKAAEQAVKKVKGTPLIIDPKQDILKIREAYKSNNCMAAFVPDGQIVARVMEGPGIECASCGFPSGPTGPKWFVVLQKTKQTGAEIQEASNISGRICDEKSGLCFQFGKNVPVYTLEELFAFKYQLAAATAAGSPGTSPGMCT